MNGLGALVIEAKRLAGTEICADGHTWVFIGGAACCNQDHEDAVSESKPVHECSRCGDCDYGDHFCRNECPNRNLKAAP
jgi:hypothetical protein